MAALVIAGCTTGPTYHRPFIEIPPTFKQAHLTSSDESASWQPAHPSDHVIRGEWWRHFNDETLTALEQQALEHNQTLHAAAARVKQARALLGKADAARLPDIDAGFGPSRQRPSPASQGLSDHAPSEASTLWRAQLGIHYEADVFGRVASTINEAHANAQQQEALYRSVLLALQADVALAYFNIRELEADLGVYRTTVTSREETLKLIQHRYNAGDVGELDVARAITELESAQAQALDIERRRTLAEHALAVLVGQSPSTFNVTALPLTKVDIVIPAGLPSSLLERRPDIAAAERAMAAANARVGVAHAAFFPRLSLTGSAGFESSELSNVFEWSTRTFLLGPIIGAALSIPLFDGGRRDAELTRAQAAYEEDVALYRETVLKAFRDVEDNLANLRLLSRQLSAQNAALNAAQRAAYMSHVQYKEGSISYIDVIETDRTVLAQQSMVVRLHGAHIRSTINLIRALGGGWDTPLPPHLITPSHQTLAISQSSMAQ